MIRPDITVGADLIRAKRSYKIDISAYRNKLKEKYQDMIAPPAEGVYYMDVPIITRDNPAKLSEGRTVYKFRDIMSCREPLHVYGGGVLPPNPLMKRRMGLCTEQQTLYTYNRIILDCVRVTLIDSNPYKSLLPDPDLGLLTNLDNPMAFLYDYFKDEYIPDLSNSIIDPLGDIDDLITLVLKTVRDREEYIWVADIEGGVLTYGYCIDVRAYRYELQHTE